MDDDFERSDVGSQDGGSDNELDETIRDDDERQDEDMEDIDDEADEDAGAEEEGDGEGENDENENEGEENDQPSNQQPRSSTIGATDQTQTQEIDGSKIADSSHPRPEVLTASTYDIVPTIAAPQSTSINAICGTADSRWIFTGGADGYIRQYSWVESVNGKTQLTVAQRHPFVDSVVKAGVLVTYWENWDARKQTPESTSLTTTQTLSPVYALACQSQGLWMVAGTASGAIRLQTVRHDEGHQIALLEKHTSAASVLHISSDERSLLSGSWDKTVVDWDLNAGKVRTSYAASGGQISCIESRPISAVAVPYESGEVVKVDATLSSNNATDGLNGFTNGAAFDGANQVRATTPDSLFGGDDGDDDLFGDNADGNLANGNTFSFDDIEINQTAEESAAPEHGIDTDIELTSTAPAVQPLLSSPKLDTAAPPSVDTNGVPNTEPQALANGLPHAEDMEVTSQPKQESDERPTTSDTTFMATSIDGSIRIWDRRQALPVARITPYDTPPWCLSACWSPDGNNIYAGRRNNTVEEYDLRKGLKKPERIFRFPQGSGAVTSVKAMPNGRHLVCASYDILRLYDLKHVQNNRSSVPFLIVPGHRTGTISNLYLSADCKYMMSTGGNRGWEGSPTEVLLGYEISVPKSA
ncbi:Transcription factor spt8 [Lithohypha guttulata]|uniref:Transcription factor spt8 n=1 Tax=Lithohypha guttulata TaxID=1690604 RepID=A0AAN7T4Z3_9EURO|nr:Transcription factor spt8 [Lithohypha guttulata]